MSKMEKLGKRKMITAFKVYFEKEYTAAVADYAGRSGWERISCHGCKVTHEVHFGVDSIIWEFPESKNVIMPVSQFEELYLV